MRLVPSLSVHDIPEAVRDAFCHITEGSRKWYTYTFRDLDPHLRRYLYNIPQSEQMSVLAWWDEFRNFTQALGVDFVILDGESFALWRHTHTVKTDDRLNTRRGSKYSAEAQQVPVPGVLGANWVGPMGALQAALQAEPVPVQEVPAPGGVDPNQW